MAAGSTMPNGRAAARRPLLDKPGDIAFLAVIFLIAAVLLGVYAVGQLAGLLGRLDWPHGNIADGFTILKALPKHWSDPKLAYPAPMRPDLPGLPGFIAVTALLLAAAIAVAVLLSRRGGRTRPIEGFATLADLDKALSVKAVLAKAESVRPSLSGTRKVALTEVGVSLGTSVFHKRAPLALSVEASVLLLAAPRQGKTSQVIIPWLSTWPGAALVTSVRPDVLAATHQLRAARGPVLVMDPTGEVSWPDMLAWSPTAGCRDYKTALDRADVLVTVGKNNNQDSENATFFGMSASNLLAAWLHAAALDGRGMDDVLAWAFDDTSEEPVLILRRHEGCGASPRVAQMLANLYNNAAPQTKASLWATVQTGLAPLLTQSARATFAPRIENSVDIEAFLRAGGTIYLLSSEKSARQLAPLIAAFVDEVTLVAQRLARHSPRHRLDPPLGLFLDEVANVVPLPNLPTLMSHGAGSGIFIVAVLQAFAQAEDRWGIKGAEMLWGSATAKVALAGLGGEELERFSRLAGTYREQLTSNQTGAGAYSLTTTLNDRPTASPEKIRTLKPGEAFVLEATTPPMITVMPRHYTGAAGEQHQRSVEEYSRLSRLRPANVTPEDRVPHAAASEQQ